MGKTCTHCETRSDIPFAAYEAGEVRHERREKRLWIALIIAIVMIFVSHAGWLYAWMQYDYVSEEIIVDSNDGGNANYIGNDGDIVNGEGYSTEATPDTAE